MNAAAPKPSEQQHHHHRGEATRHPAEAHEHSGGLSDFARQLYSQDRTKSDGTGKGEAARASAEQYVHKHGFPNVTIVGAANDHELRGKTQDGQFVNIGHGSGKGDKEALTSKSAEPVDPESKARPTGQQKEGWGSIYQRNHGFMSADEAKVKRNQEAADAAARRGEDPGKALEQRRSEEAARSGRNEEVHKNEPSSSGFKGDALHGADGSGLYSADGGKSGAWGATKNALIEKAKQQGIENYNPSNNAIANAERQFAHENGFDGKNGVKNWAKSLKQGGLFDTPKTDLREPGFEKAVKESIGPNGRPTKDTVEQRQGGDGRQYVVGKVDEKTDFVASVDNEKGTGGVKGAKTSYTRPTEYPAELYNPNGSKHEPVRDSLWTDFGRGKNGDRTFTIHRPGARSLSGHFDGGSGRMVVDQEAQGPVDVVEK
jgi:hypothetical protein